MLLPRMLRINIITYSKLKTVCLENPENTSDLIVSIS
jgi:hypothetical protein